MENMDQLIERYKTELSKMAKKKAVEKTKPNYDKNGYEKYEDEDYYKDNGYFTDENESESYISDSDTDYSLSGEKISSSEVPFNKDENGTENKKYETDDGKQDYYGTLKIMAYTGNESFPVETALVKVRDENGKVLFEGYTDRNGIIESITLPALSEKLTDESREGKVFNTYELTVSHPSYRTVVLKEVPIFDSVKSVQPVDMEIGSGEEVIVESEALYNGGKRDA